MNYGHPDKNVKWLVTLDTGETNEMLTCKKCPDNKECSDNS